MISTFKNGIAFFSGAMPDGHNTCERKVQTIKNGYMMYKGASEIYYIIACEILLIAELKSSDHIFHKLFVLKNTGLYAKGNACTLFHIPWLWSTWYISYANTKHDHKKIPTITRDSYVLMCHAQRMCVCVHVHSNEPQPLKMIHVQIPPECNMRIRFIFHPDA